MTNTEAIYAVESILEDVDALIGAFLDAGEEQNAQALCQEFKEWFLEYDLNQEMNVMVMKVL